MIKSAVGAKLKKVSPACCWWKCEVTAHLGAVFKVLTKSLQNVVFLGCHSFHQGNGVVQKEKPVLHCIVYIIKRLFFFFKLAFLLE